MNRPAHSSAAHVLVVDDDAGVRTALGQLLRSEAYSVTLAANGQEALDRLEGGDIDLVLLDLNMPVKNGWDTFERITSVNPSLPIILITARPDQHRLAVAAGASALMEKPLNLPVLLTTIKELLAEPTARRWRRVAGHSRHSRHHAAAA